jgi:hypothetical protein
MKPILKMTGLRAAVCAAALLASAGSASAATYFFTFANDDSSANVPGSNGYGDVVINGQFTTADSLLPSAVTGISGTVTGGNSNWIVDGNITGLSSYANADNILFHSGVGAGDYESFNGISFTVSNGTLTADYNLYGWDGATFLLASTIDSTGFAENGTDAGNSPGTGASVSGVPEPSTWAFMLFGICLLGAALRWHVQADRKLEALRNEVVA